MKISFGNKIRAGQRDSTEIVQLDLALEDMHFVLMVGAPGAGKSFFHRHVYRDLVENRLPKDIAFLFFDATGQDAREWQHSSFLYRPIVRDPKTGLQILEDLWAESERRHILAPNIPELIVHIEEDTFAKYDRARFDRALRGILAHRRTNGIYIFYSTSIVDRTLLDGWLGSLVALRVVFKMEEGTDALWLTGETIPTHFVSPGEHLLVFREEKIHCAALADTTEIL